MKSKKTTRLTPVEGSNVRYRPEEGITPPPPGKRTESVFYFTIGGGPEIVFDEVMGAWQEDGTLLLDRPVDHSKVYDVLSSKNHFFHFTLKPVRHEPQHNEAESERCREPQQEPQQESPEDDFAYSRLHALRLAKRGEDFVLYRYYQKNRRVLVRRHLLQDDFDGTYERLCAYLGEAPVVVLEDNDFVHFRERTGR